MCFRKRQSAKNSAETLAEIDAKIREDMRRSAVRVTFWGTMILDPNKVYVSEEQAQRSMNELERLVAASHKPVASPT